MAQSVIDAIRDTLTSKCGFNTIDFELMRNCVSTSAERTDEDLKAYVPLQKIFAGLLSKLPQAKSQTAEGIEELKVDQSTEEYKDFMRLASDMATDRLTMSANYTCSYVKIPTPSGKHLWIAKEDHKDDKGVVLELDPAVYPHFSTTGAMIDPRVRFKTTDADLVRDVIEPLRKKFKQARSTALSRLRTRAGGGRAAIDFGKRFSNLEKNVRALYKAAKEEEFNVGNDAALKKAIKDLQRVCGLGVAA